MAGINGAVSDSEGSNANSVGMKDGPVLTMMSKRLRALKKKYNRILQIEDNKAHGKPVNREQDEVLKTKVAVAALIDEYEKLRQPLFAAVKEELAEREKELLAASLERKEEEESMGGEKDSETYERDRKESVNVPSGEVRKDSDAQAVSNGDGREFPGSEFLHEEDHIQGQKRMVESHGLNNLPDGHIADLLKLLYFAHLFDVRSQREAPSLVWTKVHERSSCLSYDFVTDDSTSPLLEDDLDAFSLFGSLLTSRPPDATLSHNDTLQQCIQHAVMWLQNSDHPIRSDLGITYSHMRERLNRVLSSEYYTMTPELQTVSEQTAAAAATTAGQYAVEALAPDPSRSSDVLEIKEASSLCSNQQDQDQSQQQLFQNEDEHIPSDPLETTASSLDLPDSDSPSALESGTTAIECDSQNVVDQMGTEPEVPQLEEIKSSVPPQQQHDQQTNVFQTVGPRGYQGTRGRGTIYGIGGRGRGYLNGRGRGVRGGYYANGGRGQYYMQGGYFPRNYYGRTGGRGNRGGMAYYGYTNGPVSGTVQSA
eukprot:c28609_g1_i1 orf=92-1705(+)